MAGEEGEAAADGAAAAPAAAEQPAAEAEDGQQQRRKLDLDSIVDLSSLDLSILEQPARMPPLARVRSSRHRLTPAGLRGATPRGGGRCRWLATGVVCSLCA